MHPSVCTRDPSLRSGPRHFAKLGFVYVVQRYVLDFLHPMWVLRRLLFLVLLADCASGATGTPATPPSAARPNLILITLDTTRADRMGFLGSDRGLTPSLDAFAKDSTVFARAYAQVPLTTPSHAALLTGTYPQFNHIEDLGAPLGKDIPYLPDL